jgi:hypothetical protein
MMSHTTRRSFSIHKMSLEVPAAATPPLRDHSRFELRDKNGDTVINEPLR